MLRAFCTEVVALPGEQLGCVGASVLEAQVDHPLRLVDVVSGKFWGNEPTSLAVLWLGAAHDLLYVLLGRSGRGFRVINAARFSGTSARHLVLPAPEGPELLVRVTYVEGVPGLTRVEVIGALGEGAKLGLLADDGSKAELKWLLPFEPPPPSLPVEIARATAVKLPRWTAAWRSHLARFSSSNFRLTERVSLPDEIASPNSWTEEWRYDPAFAKARRSAFRPSPSGRLWADIYVRTFGLEGAVPQMTAYENDISHWVLLEPATGVSQALFQLGIACGFHDAYWASENQTVAVGACVDDGWERPFVVHVDLERRLLERFDSPDDVEWRFDWQRYIRSNGSGVQFCAEPIDGDRENGCAQGPL